MLFVESVRNAPLSFELNKSRVGMLEAKGKTKYLVFPWNTKTHKKNPKVSSLTFSQFYSDRFEPVFVRVGIWAI